MIVKHNHMITPSRAAKILSVGVNAQGEPIEEVKIRTILTCRSHVGICAKCYGANMATGEAVHHPHINAIPNLYVTDFIKDMAAAYAAADLVISRAGAGSISEFCLLHKPVILVPSPNVAEDHQTKNALALVNKQAAIYVKDSEAETTLMDVALSTVNDEQKLKGLTENIAKLALPDSARIIAQEVSNWRKQRS